MPELYRNRNFMVYVTVDGVMEKAKEYCEKYGYTLSKLGLISVIEKLEREEQKRKSLQGSRIATPATQAAVEEATPTPTTTTVTSNPKADSLRHMATHGVRRTTTATNTTSLNATNATAVVATNTTAVTAQHQQ